MIESRRYCLKFPRHFGFNGDQPLERMLFVPLFEIALVLGIDTHNLCQDFDDGFEDMGISGLGGFHVASFLFLED
jgi:hypothetical protein